MFTEQIFFDYLWALKSSFNGYPYVLKVRKNYRYLA